jgi:hypothetical protein
MVFASVFHALFLGKKISPTMSEIKEYGKKNTTNFSS